MSTGFASRPPDRELRAEVRIAARPERVWSVLTDLRRMPQWSPELVAMVPLKHGGLRPGQWYLGVNRRRLVVWPTRNVVSTVEAGRTLAWDTRSSGARWIYEVEPDGADSRVVLRRPVPRRLTRLSRVVAPALLGGSASHAEELEAGMQTTLDRLKVAVEAG